MTPLKKVSETGAQRDESWRVHRTVTRACRKQSNAQLEAQIEQRGKDVFYV